MAFRKWIIPACTAAGGLAAGLLLGGVFRGDPGVVPVIAAPEGPAAGGIGGENRGAAPSAVSLEEIRRVVREELVASQSGRETDAAYSAAAAQPRRPSDAAIAAGEDARRVLDAAIARRRWTRDDADSLRARFHAMSVEEQDELLRQFSMAVNQDRLVVETDQVPF